jgi:RNA polymerase sigma-70 factor, ECF subfamily
MMVKLNDLALVTQVLVLNKTQAFDQLVRKYQETIRRFFLNQTSGDKELSDDLAQETFIKAYINLKSFQKLSSFSTWLYRIAYNVFYDYIRSQKETLDVDSAEVQTMQSNVNSDSGQSMDIYRSLSILKEAERTCITLFYLEDQSIENIAAITKLSANTVKSHLKRGKEKMAIYLKENGYDR